MRVDPPYKDPNILFSVFQFLIIANMKLAKQKIHLYIRIYSSSIEYCLIIEAEPVVSVLHLFLCDEHKQSHDTTSLQFQQWCLLCKDGCDVCVWWSVLYGYCDKTKHCYNKAKIRESLRLFWNYTLLQLCNTSPPFVPIENVF